MRFDRRTGDRTRFNEETILYPTLENPHRERNRLIQYLPYLNSRHTMLIKKLERNLARRERISSLDNVIERGFASIERGDAI